MRASTLVMVGFAVVFGLLAVFIAQIWLDNQAAMRAKVELPGSGSSGRMPPGSGVNHTAAIPMNIRAAISP